MPAAGLGALVGGSADDVIGTFVVLSIVFLLFGIGFAVVGNDHRAGVRRVLASGQPWALVEAVVVSGLVADGSARTVGVVHPGTGEIEWWTVKGGGERGWLQGDDRTWFWAVRGTKGKKAVIATADRSDVALLEKRVLGKLVISEARAQVDHERAGWQHQQAWQQWQAWQSEAAHQAHAAAQGIPPAGPPVSGAPVSWDPGAIAAPPAPSGPADRPTPPAGRQHPGAL